MNTKLVSFWESMLDDEPPELTIEWLEIYIINGKYFLFHDLEPVKPFNCHSSCGTSSYDTLQGAVDAAIDIILE